MLDDFGTGYSSLSNLQLFPFDFVKIDCPFVDNRGVFQANMSMVAAMIQLAGSLDLTPIAEIVEGEAAAASLKAMGAATVRVIFSARPSMGSRVATVAQPAVLRAGAGDAGCRGHESSGQGRISDSHHAPLAGSFGREPSTSET